MKDIITESRFDIGQVVALLKERLQARDPNARIFVVSWFAALACVPDINMVQYLPQFLSELLVYVGDESPEVREATKSLLDELLKELLENDMGDQSTIIRILISHVERQGAFS